MRSEAFKQRDLKMYQVRGLYRVWSVGARAELSWAMGDGLKHPRDLCMCSSSFLEREIHTRKPAGAGRQPSPVIVVGERLV